VNLSFILKHPLCPRSLRTLCLRSSRVAFEDNLGLCYFFLTTNIFPDITLWSIWSKPDLQFASLLTVSLKIWRNAIGCHVLVTSDDVRFSQSLPSHSANQRVFWIVCRIVLDMSGNLRVSFELTGESLHKGLCLQWNWQRKWNQRSTWQQIETTVLWFKFLALLDQHSLFSITYHASFETRYLIGWNNDATCKHKSSPSHDL
jgi:hypothetical protein